MQICLSLEKVLGAGLCRQCFCGYCREFGVVELKKVNRAQARSRRGSMGTIPPIPKVAPKIFRSIKLLIWKPKKYFSATQQNCLRNSFWKLGPRTKISGKLEVRSLIPLNWFNSCIDSLFAGNDTHSQARSQKC